MRSEAFDMTSSRQSCTAPSSDSCAQSIAPSLATIQMEVRRDQIEKGRRVGNSAWQQSKFMNGKGPRAGSKRGSEHLTSKGAKPTQNLSWALPLSHSKASIFVFCDMDLE
jgi:hypothetical protein